MHMYKLVKSYFYYLFKKSKDNKCIHDQTSLGTYGLYDKNKKKRANDSIYKQFK